MSHPSRSRTRPASLWIGTALDRIEQLSLLSLIRHGMSPVLYSYETPRNLPDGVDLRDARDILPQESIFLNNERKSYAPFSDMFRYEMLAKTDFYWLDCDVLALRPFDFEGDYFMAWHPPIVASGVLSLPKTSPTLAALRDACRSPRADFPWLARYRADLQPQADENGALAHSVLPYKALGPQALTWLLCHHGEDHHALSAQTHYAAAPRQILKSASMINRKVDLTGAYSVHLFSSVQYRKLRESGLHEVPSDSYLAQWLRDYDLPTTLCTEG